MNLQWSCESRRKDKHERHDCQCRDGSRNGCPDQASGIAKTTVEHGCERTRSENAGIEEGEGPLDPIRCHELRDRAVQYERRAVEHHAE
jgi:hypothetical protein